MSDDTLKDATKPLSPLKWMAGVLAFLVVVIGSMMFGMWMRPPAQPATATPDLFQSIALMVIGVVLCMVGAVSYLIAIATRAFTFRFDRPFFQGFGAKLWFLNLVISLCLIAGFAFVVAPTLSTALSKVLPAKAASLAGFFIPFFAAQIFFIWFQLWAPVERSIIVRRLLAMGAPPQVVARGIPIGISDPRKNSLKKLTLIEEDLGMLWLDSGQLRYSGDSVAFTLTPSEVLSVERKADAGSTSAYFGAVHVILHYTDDQGNECRVRFHPEGDWTMTAKARSLNALADRLNSWKASAATPTPPPIPTSNAQR